MRILFLPLILTISSILTAQSTEINLTDVEVYDPAALMIYKVEQNYLLSTTMPSDKIQIVSSKGELLFVYDVEGQGPGELNAQSILTITPNEIFVNSIGVGVLVFDHQLNLLTKTEKAKRLQQEFSMTPSFGENMSGDHFSIFGHRFLEYHVYNFSLKDAFGKGIWEPTSKDLKKYHENVGIRDPEISVFHGSSLFSYRLNIKQNQDEYQIFAHKFHNNRWAIVAELVGPVDEMLPWLGEIKGVINNVFEIETGYLVEAAGAHPTSTAIREFTSHFDYFDKRGVYQKRVTMLNFWVFPVGGSREILGLVHEGEDDILRTIEASSIKP